MRILNREFCDEKVMEKIELGKNGKVAKNTKLLNFAFFIENIEDSNTNIF
jgi:hypothetical protein